MMSIFKCKTKTEKDNALLEQLCDNLKDRFLTTDVVITVAGEGGDPSQEFCGKLILSRYPIDAKPNVPQTEWGLHKISPAQ